MSADCVGSETQHPLVEEARAERATEAEQAIRFRSILDRAAEDQREAIRRGYDSVEQLAIDELGRAYHQLLDRIEDLERRHVEFRRRYGGLGDE